MTTKNKVDKRVRKLSAVKKKELQTKQNTFINELVRQRYHITNTIQKLKIGRATYYKWVEEYPDFKKRIESLRDQEIDVFEDAHRDLVKERNPQAVIFGLKTRGASRGWQEKQVVETKNFNVTAIKILEPGEDVVPNGQDESDPN